MKLKEWMKKRGVKVDDVAKQVGVGPRTVYRFLDGTRIPNIQVMRSITELTRGKVTANDFYYDK